MDKAQKAISDLQKRGRRALYWGINHIFPGASQPVTPESTDATTNSTTGGSKSNVNHENISEEISFSDSVRSREQNKKVQEIDVTDAHPRDPPVPTTITPIEPTPTPRDCKEKTHSDSVHVQQSNVAQEIDAADASTPVTRVPTDVAVIVPTLTTGSPAEISYSDSIGPRKPNNRMPTEMDVAESRPRRSKTTIVSTDTTGTPTRDIKEDFNEMTLSDAVHEQANKTDSAVSSSLATCDSTSTIDKHQMQYQIGSKRLAVFVGINQFEMRGADGENDGSGNIDTRMNRPEVKMDKTNMQDTMEKLGFTFRSNIFVVGEKAKTTKAEVDQFIKDVIKEAEGMDIIALIISSHGEEVVEQVGNNNVVRHRFLLIDSHMYTDDLMSEFENHHRISEIPKLFFIQACRSRVSDDENDQNDLGVDIAVQVSKKMQQGTDLIHEETPTQEAGMSMAPVPMNPSTKSRPVSVPENDRTQNKDTESQCQSTEGTGTSPRPSVVHACDSGQTSNRLITTVVEPVSPTEIQSIRCIPHSLVMYASAPGKLAYRGSINGGWLIYALSEGLKEWSQAKNCDEDLLQVLTKIIGEISTKETTTDTPSDPHYKSAACFSHMLVKDIYLCT